MGQYIRHAIVGIDEVVEHLKLNWGIRGARTVLENGHDVGVGSLRLQTFCRASESRRGITCKACGIQAKYFAVESFAGSIDTRAHLNLYGEANGKEVLFTHDHVLPKSRGGKDNLNNSQVMCQPCNSSKGSRSDRKFKAEKRQQKC